MSLLHAISFLWLFSCYVVSDSFVTPWAVACQVLCPWHFPGKNTGADCHSHLQGTFWTQGWDPTSLMSLALQVDALLLSHRGSPCHFTYLSNSK